MSVGKRVVRADGHGGAEMRKGIIELFPLDDFVEVPLAVMKVPDNMLPGNQAPIWAEFRKIADTDLPTAKFEIMDLILRKGVVRG